jgi:RNA polymerase sigma-70 factor (ECF subfamily)
MRKRIADPDRDPDLLLAYRDGDADAFQALVAHYQDRMVQFFYRLCWDRDRAEDLCQDLFLKLMQGCRRYRPEGKLSTFVYRVATNLWIDHYRSQRPHRRLFSLDQATLDMPVLEVAGHEPDPSAKASDDEERARLRCAMESLTAPHRIVFELAVYQERPYAEIGQLLDIPVGTVKSRMHNAVAALKQLLDPAAGEGEEQGRKVSGGG